MYDVVVTVPIIEENEPSARPYIVTRVFRYEFETMQEVDTALEFLHRMAIDGGQMHNEEKS
jgi:hypothetical protein